MIFLSEDHRQTNFGFDTAFSLTTTAVLSKKILIAIFRQKSGVEFFGRFLIPANICRGNLLHDHSPVRRGQERLFLFYDDMQKT